MLDSDRVRMATVAPRQPYVYPYSSPCTHINLTLGLVGRHPFANQIEFGQVEANTIGPLRQPGESSKGRGGEARQQEWDVRGQSLK